jgi:hypothetical protein
LTEPYRAGFEGSYYKEAQMKKYSILLSALGFLVLTGCTPKPNLVVQNAAIDFATRTVSITVANNGTANAGGHLTYIEINQVGAAETTKPQSQYSADVSGIPAGNSWNSGPIPFSSFSSPRGLDLSSLTAANLVIRVDAKNMVEESNESDNIYDANQ